MRKAVLLLTLIFLSMLGCVSTQPQEVSAYVCEGKNINLEYSNGVESFYVSENGDLYAVLKLPENLSNVPLLPSEALILNESGRPKAYLKIPPGIWVNAEDVLKDKYNETLLKESWEKAVGYAKGNCPKEKVRRDLFEVK